MSSVEEIEVRIRGLSAAELAALRAWFAAYDAEVWDRQFEADATAGKLDRLAEQALSGHAAARADPGRGGQGRLVYCFDSMRMP